MLLVTVILALLVQTSPPACADAASCRQAALEAKERNDYEAFHDLAWLAYRKGKPDDPELMLLLARAQSLSGRPGDAVVMLERLAARRVATDVATSEDFDAVRNHPRWNKTATAAPDPAPAAIGDLRKPPVASERATPPPPVPPKSAVDLAPKTPPVAGPKAASRSASKASPLSFTTLLSATALAYDGVSKRYLIADREAKRIAVIDENTGQVSMLAGAGARLGEIHGMAIDARQGDLWVVTSAEEGHSLTRLQLVSGRQLAAARISGIAAPIVSVAFARGAGLVVSDQRGDIYKVASSGRAEKLASLEYVPTAIVADADGVLYVAAGGPRIARYSLTPFRRLGVIDLEAGLLATLPFAVVRDSIHMVVPSGGGYEIRTFPK